MQTNAEAFAKDKCEAALCVDNEAVKELVEDARRSDWENNRKDFMERDSFSPYAECGPAANAEVPKIKITPVPAPATPQLPAGA